MTGVNTSTLIKNEITDILDSTNSINNNARSPTASRAPEAKSSAAAVSPLAQQLSDAARRSSMRDATMDWNELRTLSFAILDKVTGHSPATNWAARNAELPKTDNPELLARARQATDFLNSRGPNPFAGMPRDQLILIAYDEGGPFTLNERQAARGEASRQRSAWSAQFCQRAMQAYSQTGNTDANGVARELLDNYLGLSQIEKVQLPRNYEMELRMRVAQAEQADAPPGLSDLRSLLNKWEETRREHRGPIDGDAQNEPPASMSSVEENTLAAANTEVLDPDSTIGYRDLQQLASVHKAENAPHGDHAGESIALPPAT